MPNEIKDLRTQKHFSIEHRFYDEYLPALGGNAFMLYSVYCRLASSFNKVFPSLRTIQKYTGFSRSSIAKYNCILEELLLIKIEKRLSGNGDSENNIYYLLEPKPLSDELRRKYYPESWEPILKLGGGLKFGPPQVVQNLDHRGPENEPRVVQKLDRINKDFDSVVNLHTTTLNAILDAALPYCGVDASKAVVGLEVIFKTALKRFNNPETAGEYVIEKVSAFSESLKTAKNPLAMLHAAVKGDWQDMKSVKKQEAAEFEKRMARANEDREKILRDAWLKLPDERKAELWKPGLKYDFFRRNKKWPLDHEMNEIVGEFIREGRYGIFSISSIPPDFKPEELR